VRVPKKRKGRKLAGGDDLAVALDQQNDRADRTDTASVDTSHECCSTDERSGNSVM